MKRVALAAVLLCAASDARAEEPRPMTMGPRGEYVMGASPPDADWATRAAPMLMPVRNTIPGAWTRPGTWNLMGNAALILTNPGFSDAYDAGLGRTTPYLLASWIMGRARTEGGVLEGLVMLDFEALTLSKQGWYEVGQAGEGLYDRQHPHQLLHQALVAVHLMGERTEGLRATLWGGQGTAPIGPPIFMHRGSNPSPTVPRKHHKGENPHETFPVFGATIELGDTALDVAGFSGYEPGPTDSRVVPFAGVPKSYGARIRHAIGGGFEAQLSAVRLQADGDPATQVSASVYGRWVGRFVVDALLDGAADAGGHGHGPEEGGGPYPGPSTRAASHAHDDVDHSKHPQHASTRTAAALAEIAVRTASLRDVGWTRVELNQRLEPDNRRSTPWWFFTLGYERVVWVDPDSVVGVGFFGETTYVVVPESVAPYYGDRTGVTVTAGVRGQLMIMPEHQHHHHR